MKQKILILLLAGAMLFTTGCSVFNSAPNGDGTAGADELPVFLTKKIWSHSLSYCSTIDKCKELIYFSQTGKLCYYEGCGSSLGIGDSYKDYTYDSDTGIITLYEAGGTEAIGEMKIISYDENRMLLQTDLGVKEFFIKGTVFNIVEDCREYMSGYSAFYTFVEMQGNSVTVGPSHYEGDEDDLKALVEDRFTSNAEFYLLDIQTTINGSEETSTHTYEKITKSDAEALLDDGPYNAFVWYNDDVEIEKVICYKVTKIRV